MTQVLRISAAQRRARLGWRHRLAGGALATGPEQVARSLVAVHSTDPSSVYLALLARMAPAAGLSSVDRALYEDRTLIRLLGMRRTVFVAPLDNAALIQAACSRAVAARERRKVLSWLAEAGVGGDPETWLAEVEQAALAALTVRGGRAGGRRRAAGHRAGPGRGQELPGAADHRQPRPAPAGRPGAGRARQAARLVDLPPVPLGAADRVVPTGAGRLGSGGRRGGAGPPLARGLRAGHGR
jgi:Winged helix DNA-binding domain